MPKRKSDPNWSDDIKRGVLGEFASLVAMSVHMPGIEKVELSKVEKGSTPDDFNIITKDANNFFIDMKTDWKSFATGNMFFEPVSQLQRTDEHIFPACNVKDVFRREEEVKEPAAKCVCDTVMDRIVSGEQSGLPQNRDGWGIKNLDHLVGYWAIDAPGRSFEGKEHIIKKCIDKTEINGGSVRQNGIQNLRVLHDDFMDEMRVKRYVLYILDKTLLLSHIKKNYPKYTVRGSYNYRYMTLGYLVPLKELDKLAQEYSKYVKRYTWRVE